MNHARTAPTSGADYYPTPAWATRALVACERFTGPIWEPACGDGTMARELAAAGYQVQATDLFDYGFSQATSGADFLKAKEPAANIITNPPYNLAESFVHKALELATGKVALLLRLAFLESATRQRTIFSKTPPARVWVFSERITFYPNGRQTAGSGTTAYAWFIWDKQTEKRNPEILWIPLGFKNR